MVRQATEIIRGVREALFWGCDLLSCVAPHPVILSTRLGTPGALCTLLLSPVYGPPLSDSTTVAGSVRYLEVVAVEAAVVEAAALLRRRHHSHLCCQSINLQTFATGEKKC